MITTSRDTGARFLDAVGLTARRVIDDEDVEWLRVIRNTCRLGFAHDTAPIAHTAQEQWWRANQGDVIAYLYQETDGFVVGYGVIRRDADGVWWSSVAVLPTYSGHGYGGAITAHIVRQSPTGVTQGQARKDNPAACRLHHQRDWEVVGDDGRLLTFRTREVLP
jgi:GNAT superfamily N-acetyltransferase